MAPPIPASTQLLSPEGVAEPGRPATGTLLVAELRRISREKMMGIKQKEMEEEEEEELDIQHTPTAQSRIQSLLYAGSNSPSSRHSPKKLNIIDRNDDGLPDELLSTHHGQMPSSFANLLALHNALEKALLLHLATQGASAAMTVVSTIPSQASTTPDQRMVTPEPESQQQQRSRRAGTPDQEDEDQIIKTFRLESLVSWPVIKPIVERGSGKSFGERELAQLLWLWQNDPDQSRTHDTKQTQKRKRTSTRDDSTDKLELDSSKEQVGMGFIISRIRSLDPTNTLEQKRLRYTYGIGLEITARENRQMPSYSLQSPGKSTEFLESPSRSTTSTENARLHRKSPSRVKAKDVMNLVALWSSKSVDRKTEVARRLRAFWVSHSIDPKISTPPSTSNSSPTHSKKICIPLANLPKLDQQQINTLQPSHPFTRPSASSNGINHTPDLKRHRIHLSSKPPQNSPSKLSPASNTAHSSVVNRAQSLLERIKAKENKLAKAGN
ncbi:hypothetical protein MJO29_014177 [Puccinia striiformis f. sp. tritici]|uniref:Uncharacterized protein n=1 Tax=Puccinia striiformis f. sp. tritici PST-78 TaxID=1165861 RepID=A0A0L0W3W1_9BASI|nr:hypothetical protein MJO29_014177 [Puccinia striiformis f. sp. tritici]KAI9616512.1 hypothetical protein H4Q26_010908 [Puccinia striiformis f. sp. tritici PST-130]KNF06162.1 hypothetical protein PSTG_00670 [Puccinia striiformis f. sp. tritici PST-78]